MGVDTQLIFTNESVIPNATSFGDNLKTGINELKVFLGSVNISSVIVGEFSFSQAVLYIYIYNISITFLLSVADLHLFSCCFSERKLLI